MIALLRQRLRRDRWTTPIWIVSTALLGLVGADGVVRQYSVDSERIDIIRLAVANPTILLLRGLPQGSSIDQFVFFEIFTYLALMAGLMTTFMVVRHSRAEEETGRAELIGSTPAGRLLPTLTTVVVALAANVVLAVAVALGFIAGGLDAAGSFVAGAATGGTGVAFIGVALLAAQFVRSSRAANSISVALVLGSFVARGLGDAFGTPSADGLTITSSWPSWISPIGWGQHTNAFGGNTVLPLALDAALFAVALSGALALQSRRDLGASLLAGRSGRVTASSALSNSFGLAWRLQWPSIVGWAIGGALTGVFAGSLSPLIRQAAGQSSTISDSLQAMAGTQSSIDQALLVVMFSITAVLAAAAGIQAIARLRQEEAAGTAELILTAPVQRVRWFLDYVVVGAIAVVAVLVSAAVSAVVSILAVGGSSDLIGDAVAAATAQLPAALVFVAVLALVFATAPAMTIPFGWAALGLLTVLGVFGPLLGLDDWVTHISPFANTPVPFADDPDWAGAIVMLAISAVAVVAAAGFMRRRELRT